MFLQYEMIDELLKLRQKQLKIFEDLTMFEQRILCHKLPNSFNSITINNNEVKSVNENSKMVQDSKRQMLNAELEQYELKIQNYEHQYEQQLAAFQSACYKRLSTDNCGRSKSKIESKSIRLSFKYRSVQFHLKLKSNHSILCYIFD